MVCLVKLEGQDPMVSRPRKDQPNRASIVPPHLRDQLAAPARRDPLAKQVLQVKVPHQHRSHRPVLLALLDLLDSLDR